MFDDVTMILFPIYFYILKMGDIISLYIEANGLYWETRFRTISEMVANVVLNYVFIKILGARGAVLSTIITMLIFSFIWGGEIVFNYYFNDGRKEYYVSHLKYGAVTAFVASVSYFACGKIQYDNLWITFAIKAIVCITIPGGLYYFIYRKNRLFKDTMILFKATFVP